MEDVNSNSYKGQGCSFIPDTPHMNLFEEQIIGETEDNVTGDLEVMEAKPPHRTKENVSVKEELRQDSSECDKESQVISECDLEPEVVVESVWVKQEKLDLIEDEENSFENEEDGVEGEEYSNMEKEEEELIHEGEDFLQSVENPAKSTGGHSSEIISTVLGLPYQNDYIQRYMAMHMANPNRTEGKHKCSECPYSTSVAGRLKAHMVTHTGERPFKCTVCPYSSSMAGTLKRHLATHSGDKPYKCPVCPYSGGQPGNLKRHLATHTVIRPYKCTACSYSSATVGTLKIHMKTHTGIRPFECPLCPYRSSRTSTLKIHMVTHTGHKPYKCSECSFSSSEARHLRRHMASHSADVTLNLSPCDYSAAQSSGDVTECSSTPSCEKSFQCVECDFKCAYKYVLKRHMMWKHDGLRPYGCAHCHYGSMSKQALVTHLAKYHKDDMM